MQTNDWRGPNSYLVVEDDTFDRNLMRRCIGRDRPDLDLFEVSTLGSARRFLEQSRPDMIVLDHFLPDGEGASFARELQSHGTWSDTLICVVTSADPSTLDTAHVPVIAKHDLTPQSLWALVDVFLAERNFDPDTDVGRAISDFGDTVQAGLASNVSRMLRTLRRARATARRSIPRAAMNDLDALEDMLMTLSETVDRRH
ncbi:response regulator [Sagittula sp. SSi028]|uniref:response regulator n=1 Tax=Sagittula sp. SSi028 TaxID=3400636 RepID=UPI003AF664AE